MKEYKKLSENMKTLMEKASELGWQWYAWIEESQENRKFIEIGKHSPAGEDFSMVIDFDAENQCESFLDKLGSYYEDFDIDEHIEMWIEARRSGTRGIPSTRELVEDAEDIKHMILDLLQELQDMDKQDLELSDDQVARNDEIYNAVFDMCKVVADDEELEWDMYYIGEIAELAANMMVDRGYKVRFPAIVTEEDGSRHIEEYYNLEQEGGVNG